MFPLKNKLSWKERLTEKDCYSNVSEMTGEGLVEGKGFCNVGEVVININRLLYY